MDRNLLLSMLPALAGALGVGEAKAAERDKIEERPNILFIVTDDLGKGDLSCYGNPIVRTPHIDQIGRKGVQLMHYRSAAPISGPSRVSLLTGRYHERSGYRMTHNSTTSSLQEPWLARQLRDGGYSTAAIGKWHLGDNRFRERGFDHWVITAPGGWSDYYMYKVLRPDTPIQQSDGTYVTDFLTNEAIDFIRSVNKENKRTAQKTPFFLYLAYNAPHFPLQVPEEEIEPFRHCGLEAGTEILYGMVTRLDKNIGRLMSELEELGLEENTLVVFVSDNGPCLGSYKGLRQNRWNCDLGGAKEYVLEGGINVPCLVQWPCKIKPRKENCRVSVHATDWAPTLLAAAGILPSGKSFDGINCLPMLEETGVIPMHVRYWCYNKAYPSDLSNCAVIDGRWKLYRPLIEALNRWNNRGQVPENIQSEEWCLFDLEADPGEKQDVADLYPEIRDTLIRRFECWWREVLEESESISGPAKK